MRTRRLCLLAALVAVMLVTAAWSQLRPKPPQVYAELPERVTAGEAFTVLLSADRPVLFQVAYGAQEIEEVAQDLTLELVGVGGEEALYVTLRDGAGAESQLSYPLVGLTPLRPLVQAPAQLRPGQPFAVHVEWAVPDEALSDLRIALDGEALTSFRGAGGATAISSVPLGAMARTLELAVTLADTYGRVTVVTRPMVLEPDEQPVQLIDMPASTLSVVTPDNQRLETEVLSAAYEDPAHGAAPLWREAFLLPAEGRFTSPFGLPRRYAPEGSVSYHHGTDIAAPEGTPIRAANGGRVAVAGFYPIRGGLVVLDHGAGVHSLYFHQSRLHVAVGDEVARGQIIGEIGTTGLSTGPHLHWEMRVRGVSTDPMSWIDRVWP